MVRHLEFAKMSPGDAFHAALVQHQGAGGGSGPLHTHDFWEAMYILEGRGEHHVGNERLTLLAGQILLIRPADRHAIRSDVGRRLLYINIAFPTGSWQEFCSLAGLAQERRSWLAAASPPCISLPDQGRESCAEAFRRALHGFTVAPTKLELCRFWSSITYWLILEEQPEWRTGHDAPAWFERALSAMEQPENLRAGLPRLRKLSGVSPPYLARTVREYLGRTPTEYLNELRLRRASLLLRTTTKEIIEVAYECGFDNLSYFYRLFRARYGCPPKAFRLVVGEEVAPGASRGELGDGHA